MSTPRPATPWPLLLGIFLIATNLRAPVTAAGPLLEAIRAELGLGATAASALIALPLLSFALVSPLGVLLARRLGLERSLFVAMLLVGAGVLWRSLGQQGGLFGGTALIGAGIAVGNVLLPSLVKRDFSARMTATTSAYSLAMGIAAALGSALAVPLAQAGGWRLALGAMLVLPLAACVAWLPQLGGHAAPAAPAAVPARGARVWRSALAWQVTLFLGMNSVIYYATIAWLPTVLVDAGLSPAEAGSLHGVMQLATAVPGLLLAPIVGRLRDQRALAAGTAACSAVALLGLWLAPGLASGWAVLFGVGTGAGFILGLSFIGMRAGHAQQAAALSGMAQCVGYLLASAGPAAMAVLHDASGGWALPLAACAALALAGSAMGWLAGRERHLAPAGAVAA